MATGGNMPQATTGWYNPPNPIYGPTPTIAQDQKTQEDQLKNPALFPHGYVRGENPYFDKVVDATRAGNFTPRAPVIGYGQTPTGGDWMSQPGGPYSPERIKAGNWGDRINWTPTGNPNTPFVPPGSPFAPGGPRFGELSGGAGGGSQATPAAPATAARSYTSPGFNMAAGANPISQAMQNYQANIRSQVPQQYQQYLPANFAF